MIAFAGVANAEFNRVGSQASVNLSYVAIDAPKANDWQGVQLTNTIPLGVQGKVMNQVLRFNTDLTAGYAKSNDLDANYGQFGVGLTTWLNANFDKGDFGLAPYVRVGVAGNSGNMYAQNHQYWSYQIEPGVVAKFGAFYALGAFNYGEGFNADFGSTVEDWVVGAGVNISKSFAVEARYDMNRGSNDTNKLTIGAVYKF